MSRRNRKFGIEIEFVGVSRSEVEAALQEAGVNAHLEGHNHTTRSYWKIVSDASLHDSSGLTGEIVSPILEGEYGFAELKKVCDVLNSIPALRVNRSCGLHVHLDARDLTVSAVSKIFERYSQYEDQIDSIMPISRRGEARWCRSINKRNLRDAVKGCTTKSTQAGAMGRYYKVNLTNVATRGAVEFRQHSGTTDYTKIVNWTHFLMDFVTKSIELENSSQMAPSFDIARKIVKAHNGDISWKGSRYYVCMNGVTTKFTVEELDSFYFVQGQITEPNCFNERRFLRAIGVATTLATDSHWLDGVKTDVSEYMQARIQQVS